MPTPHLFSDGGGIVTGTHDIAEARRLVADLKIDGDDDRYVIAAASRMFRTREARLETGRIIPIAPDMQDWMDGCTWQWRDGYKLGKRGVTKAVVWYAW